MFIKFIKKLNFKSDLKYLLIFLLILASISCSVKEEIKEEEKNQPQANIYGLFVDSLMQNDGIVGKRETLTDILLPYNVSYKQLLEITKIAKGEWNVKKIQKGKKYIIFSNKDSIQSIKYFIYENDPINYVVIDFSDSISIFTGQKEIVTKEAEASGEIETSLYLTLKEQSVSDLLALKMAEIFAWQIDFYKIYKGDKFQVLYEKQFVDNEFIGVGKIIAAYFQHKNEDYYGFYYQQDEKKEYFDEEGQSLQKTFLKSPLKFSRVTSGYSKRRFHPVLHRFKSHLGTDYAAPTGTPIYAVGDGTVTKARYDRNNGNYVKIRHNGTYSTQYLHMSKIAKGIRPGVKVKQKQVIGYVGSTGLATGPHVCFRFWKNGSQVNHRRQKFPSSHPISKENIVQYTKYMDSLKTIIDSIHINNSSVIVTKADSL
ncbi:MAG: peptidoglycan DD-metalloendopeptidase family protein [Bacteroidota bacterium]